MGHLDQLDKARKALDAAGLKEVHLGGNYVSGEREGGARRGVCGSLRKFAGEVGWALGTSVPSALTQPSLRT